jgi:hypothetical protein
VTGDRSVTGHCDKSASERQREHTAVVNSEALLLIPPAGLLAWIAHASLTLSGSGPRWARWGARWGCLRLVPLACVAMWVWHY